MTLAVLAGGRGERMGRPKGDLHVRGRPILEHLLERFAWDGPTLLVTAPGREHPPGWRRFGREVADAVEGEGPLRGVLTGLRAARTEVVVFATVDMPGLGREQIDYLVGRLEAQPDCDGVMFCNGDGIEPFPLACRARAVGLVEERLAGGRRSVHGLLESGRFVADAVPDHWPGEVWRNLNTPADLERMSDDLDAGMTQRVRGVVRYDGGAVTTAGDDVAREEPLEIRVRGRAVSVTMRTPGHDAELAAGFLLSEGLIRSAADVVRVEPCGRNEEGNVLNVVLSPDVRVDFERLTRHVFASSSCGLCGKATIEAVRGAFAPVESDLVVTADVLLGLSAKMRQAQATFDRTGGLHAAALFDSDGNPVVLREDVGRHNAVDKVLGYAVLNGLAPLDRHILMVSGRTSFEILQKALAGRVPVVAAVSAPSSLAVEFARESGQTLVGFLRERRMNVYAHPRRVRFGEVK